MNPTLVLKHAIKANEKIDLTDHDVLLGNKAFDMGAESVYTNNKGLKYSLASIAYFYLNKETDHGKYWTACKKRKIEMVSVMDKERILSDLYFIPMETCRLVELPEFLDAEDLSYVQREYSALKGSHGSGRNSLRYILIPSSPSSLLSLENAEQFVGEGVYLPSRPEDMFSEKEFATVFHRQAEYRITNHPGDLSEQDWKHVAAIFIDGTTWQFKDWETRDVASTLRATPVFYLCFRGDKIPETVRRWNATVLALERDSSFPGQAPFSLFWQTLDGWKWA